MAHRNFSALQDALATGATERLVFYAFDILYLDGYDLRPLPLTERKAALAAIITKPGAVRFSEHFVEDGERLLHHVCLLGLEGVISKMRDAPYRSGRGKGWIKSKCSNRQEFVVAGYVPSTVTANAIGSLVLGYFKSGKLIHAGRVGTGSPIKWPRICFAASTEWASPRARLSKSYRPKISGVSGSCARSWSPRWSSAVGRPRVWFGTPPFEACAMTSLRTRFRSNWLGIGKTDATRMS